MGAVVTFGGDVAWNCSKATMRTIAAFIRENAPIGGLSTNQFSEGMSELNDAAGGWLLDECSLQDFLVLSELMQQLQASLPAPISHWTEAGKLVFLREFPQFRAILAERISQLQEEARDK